MVAPFDWSAYQATLDNLFHREGDAYPAGSNEYEELKDFVARLAKFRAAQAKRGVEESTSADAEAADRLGIPAKFDTRYRVNVGLITDHKRRAAQHRGGCSLPGERVEEYKQMLVLYEDFRQKRQFAKLLKLQTDRAALPISSFAAEITAAVESSQAVVIAGDTGCGKSTQLPQLLMTSGFKQIAVTQPRRIAAVSLCRRVAFETLNEYGDEIAYKIRFDSTRGRGTKVVFLTEGVLLREMVGDPTLKQYEVLVVDEVHERHLSTDLLLGLLKGILAERPDLRVILMSATIDLARYSAYFGNAPVVQVPGRLYPITVEYLPQQPDDEKAQSSAREGGKRRERRGAQRIDARPYLKILERIDQQFPAEQRGDMLVFLSGMQEMTTVADALRPYAAHTRRWVVLLLHSALSVEEQDKVFDIAPDGVRKCVLSTNIAETSVTIDGIRFVVDSGRVKEMTHDVAGSLTQSLQEGWISRASAEQRAGRAGRTGPGHCFRLYSQTDFASFPEFTTPEIRRVGLEQLVLQILALGGGDPRSFDFLDPPPPESLEAAVRSLVSHEAVRAAPSYLEGGREHLVLTPLGEVLSGLPVDVPLGKMLVLGSLFHLSGPVVAMAAALSVQSPFIRLPDGEEGDEARVARQSLRSEHGDAFTLAATFGRWIAIKRGRGGDDSKASGKWCKRHGLEEQRLYEMAKLQRQFQDLLTESGLLKKARGGGMGGGELRRDPLKRKREQQQRRDAQAHLHELQRKRDRDRGRKVLKLSEPLETEPEPEPEPDPDDGAPPEPLDIRSLELKLTVDLEALAEATGRTLGRNDVNLLKVIIASGLYPNVAVPDPNNSQRRESEALFHTRHVADARLHPASVLVGAEVPPTAREVLVYTTLLETHKLYVTNLVRLPALPALLLTGQRIHTTPDCRRLLVDDWLLLRIKEAPDVAQHVVKTACELRASVSKLLRIRLRSHGPAAKESAAAAAAADAPDWVQELVESVRSDEEVYSDDLADRLAQLLDTTVSYTCERIQPQHVPGQFARSKPPNPDRDSAAAPLLRAARAALSEGDQSAPEEGVQVAPFLRWGSLEPFESPFVGHSVHMRKHWQCPVCGEKLLMNLNEIEEHLEAHEGESKKEMFERAAERADHGKGGPDGVRGLAKQAFNGGEESESLEGEGVRVPVQQAGETSGEVENRKTMGDDVGMQAGSAEPEKRETVSAVQRKRYVCEQCDSKVYLFTPPQVLQHKRTHK